MKLQRKTFRSCFEFLQKVFLGLMYPFSCVLWAIFWSFSLLVLISNEIRTQVGVAGFEPTTPCSQSRCANRTALHPEWSFFQNRCKGNGLFCNLQIFGNLFFQSKHIYFLRHLTFDGLYLPFHFCYLPNNPLSSSSQPLPASS